jgi:dTDP-4-amino-4,6-dideoxygalactose transaminase
MAVERELKVPFNQPYVTGEEFGFIQEAIDDAHLSGNGRFSRQCMALLEEALGAQLVLLTNSCTAALEMSALLADVREGDEVIMPSFTFTSTATALVLRGAVPVFVDVRPDTLNLDERLVEAAITDRTKAIVAVHYAGVACAMDELTAIARSHGLLMIEDAAQAYGSTYRGCPLGTLGAAGTLSFHETKNVQAGEGGALIVNDETLVGRAEILHEKGTNRREFYRGMVDKYSWVDVGSSFLSSDLTAAFLWPQLLRADWINEQRLAVWNRYQEGFARLEAEGLARRPVVPDYAGHNAHLYYLLVDPGHRDELISALGARGVTSVFHYVPLHSAPAGRRFGRPAGDLHVTDRVSASLLRLPLWIGLSDEQVERVITVVEDEAARLA